MYDKLIYVYDIIKVIDLAEKINKVKHLRSDKLYARNNFDYYLKNDFFKHNMLQKPKKILSWNDLITYNYSDSNIVYTDYLTCLKIYSKIAIYKIDIDIYNEIQRYYRFLYKNYCTLNNSLSENVMKIIEPVDDKSKKKEYIVTCNKYFKMIVYNKKTKNPSPGETLVMNFLDKIAHKYKLIYFYRHRLSFCRDKLPLEFDFFCVMIYNHKLLYWVIEYDGDQHYEDTNYFDFAVNHRHDILKQYYLAQLNIHLLRLRNSNEIKKTIVDFINKISFTNKYVVTGGIRPIKKLFRDKSQHGGLLHFYDLHSALFIQHKNMISDNILDNYVDMIPLKLNTINSIVLSDKKEPINVDKCIRDLQYDPSFIFGRLNTFFKNTNNQIFIIRDSTPSDKDTTFNQTIKKLISDDTTNSDSATDSSISSVDEDEIRQILEQDDEPQYSITKPSCFPCDYHLLDLFKLISDHNKQLSKQIPHTKHKHKRTRKTKTIVEI